MKHKIKVYKTKDNRILFKGRLTNNELPYLALRIQQLKEDMRQKP